MPPQVVGVLLFPGFEVLDIAGPLEALNTVARLDAGKSLELRIIARTSEITPADPNGGAGHAFQSAQRYVATHGLGVTGLDLLLIPGGFGSMPPTDNTPEIDFIRRVYPSLQHLFTICTGSALAAQAGVLDGHRATSNKSAWTKVAALGPKTHWVARARWVVSGNIWTCSGVSAGTDGMMAFICEVFGGDVMDAVLASAEYTHEWDATNDKWSAYYNCHDIPPQG